MAKLTTLQNYVTEAPASQIDILDLAPGLYDIQLQSRVAGTFLGASGRVIFQMLDGGAPQSPEGHMNSAGMYRQYSAANLPVITSVFPNGDSIWPYWGTGATHLDGTSKVLDIRVRLYIDSGGRALMSARIFSASTVDTAETNENGYEHTIGPNYRFADGIRVIASTGNFPAGTRVLVTRLGLLEDAVHSTVNSVAANIEFNGFTQYRRYAFVCADLTAINKHFSPNNAADYPHVKWGVSTGAITAAIWGGSRLTTVGTVAANSNGAIQFNLNYNNIPTSAFGFMGEFTITPTRVLGTVDAVNAISNNFFSFTRDTSYGFGNFKRAENNVDKLTFANAQSVGYPAGTEFYVWELYDGSDFMKPQ